MSMELRKPSNLNEFYKGKTIFITGGTGYLGMLLVEKLLRSFPSVKKIFILVKTKRNHLGKERILDYFESEVFDRLKVENPKNLLKIIGYVGDITSDNLGLEMEEMKYIIQETNIIINCASSNRFNDKLNNAIYVNIHGTHNVLKLAAKIKKLECFIHISTAYSNCNQRKLEERLYIHPICPYNLIGLRKLLDAGSLTNISSTIINTWPNSYTFTKNASENLVYAYRDRLRIIIFRPGMITATWQDPIPSWINKYIGPYSCIATTALGIQRINHCPSKFYNSNLVPADLVVNAILGSIWYASVVQDCTICKGALFVNYTSQNNPCPWREVADKVLASYRETPFEIGMWYPFGIITRFKIIHFWLQLLFEICPAIIIDTLSLLMWKKPQYLSLVRRIQRNMKEMVWLASNRTQFDDDNINTIWNCMSTEDRILLNFDMKSVDWSEYLSDCTRSIKYYLLKEDLSSEALTRAKRKYLWLSYMNYIFQLGLVSIIIYFLKYLYKFLGQFYKNHNMDSRVLTNIWWPLYI